MIRAWPSIRTIRAHGARSRVTRPAPAVPARSSSTATAQSDQPPPSGTSQTKEPRPKARLFFFGSARSGAMAGSERLLQMMTRKEVMGRSPDVEHRRAEQRPAQRLVAKPHRVIEEIRQDAH